MAAVTRHLHGDLLDTLDNVLDYLDDRMDVVDGDYGEPRPNQAMSLHTELARAIERLERDVKVPVRTEEWKKKAILRVLAAAAPSVGTLEQSILMEAHLDQVATGILYALEERV